MPNQETKRINISSGTFLRFFSIILGFIAAYILRDILFSLIFAIIVASAVEPSIEWFKRRGITRILGVILVYLSMALFVVFVGYLVFPLLLQELNIASGAFSQLQGRVVQGITAAGGQTYGTLLAENASTLLQIPGSYVQNLGSGVYGLASGIFGGVFSFVLVVVFSFYLATQEKGIESFLRLVTPLAYEPYAIDLWDRAQRKLGKWLQAQLLLAAVVGVFIFIGLTMLGVEQAFLFAIMAAAFEIIPIVGPILAAIPAVTASFFVSPVLGLSVVALYIIVQQVESHVIVPVIMRKAVGLSPLIVVVALLAGAKIGGIFGILLAIPLTAIGAELLNDWDKKKRAIIAD